MMHELYRDVFKGIGLLALPGLLLMGQPGPAHAAAVPGAGSILQQVKF